MREKASYVPGKKIVMIGLLFIVFFNSYSQASYIRRYRNLSDSLSEAYGIPPGVILGVAIVESSAGKSRYCKLLNNHFGIVGKNNLMKSKKIRTRYKRYPNSRASFIDFCNLVAGRRFYKKLRGNKNCLLWVNAISKTGYSEKPVMWRERVSSAIKKNRLN